MLYNRNINIKHINIYFNYGKGIGSSAFVLNHNIRSALSLTFFKPEKFIFVPFIYSLGLYRKLDNSSYPQFPPKLDIALE